MQKQATEKEAKESLARYSSAPTKKSKDKGKSIVYGPIRTQPSSTLDSLQRSVEFRKGLEKEAMTEPQPKRQKVQEAPPQGQTEEAAVVDTQHLPQQLQRV